MKKYIKNNSSIPFDKMYTFRFYYDEPDDGFGEIEFCEISLEAAETVFNIWAAENNCPGYTSYEVVYSEDDADELGYEYGTPEEYYSKGE